MGKVMGGVYCILRAASTCILIGTNVRRSTRGQAPLAGFGITACCFHSRSACIGFAIIALGLLEHRVSASLRALLERFD